MCNVPTVGSVISVLPEMTTKKVGEVGRGSDGVRGTDEIEEVGPGKEGEYRLKVRRSGERPGPYWDRRTENEFR